MAKKKMLELFSVRTPGGTFSFDSKEAAKAYRDEYNLTNPNLRPVKVSPGKDHRNYMGDKHGTQTA